MDEVKVDEATEPIVPVEEAEEDADEDTPEEEASDDDE